MLPDGSEHTQVVEAERRYVVADPSKVTVVHVPWQMSFQQAEDVERKLTAALGRDVVVISSNLQFCRLEPLSSNEVATMVGKGL